MTEAKEFIVAHCGLACSNCGMYIKGKCEGCHSEKPMNRNCQMKACSISHGYTNCADCKEFENLKECKKLNNLVSKFFGFIFRTDRIGNLNKIREIGLAKFIEYKKEEGKA